jgi:hypothetical protein
LRPAVARSERIGGGPIHHARPTELERLAGPSAPRLVTPHSLIELTPRTQERAELRRRTRSHHTARSSSSSGSAFLLESGSEILVGINDRHLGGFFAQITA